MNEEPTSIQCGEHGDAAPTFVCGHLCRHLCQYPVQRCFCDAPSPDTPYPDAWCARCNAELMRQGASGPSTTRNAWTFRSCATTAYQDAMASSVEALDGDTQAAWIEAVTQGHHALRDKQRALEQDYGIASFERWDYDQSADTLTFSDGGVPRVVADIEFIGSVSEASGTWLWAWANFHNEAPVVSRIAAVREWGEAQGFLHLTVPLSKGDAIDGWELSGVAAQVLGAQGVYRVPMERGFLYMALMSVQRVA